MQPTQNKNSIIIGMLAVLIILAAYIAFFKKGNDATKNNEVVTPTGQTQTNQNPNGPDYQPSMNGQKFFTIQSNKIGKTISFKYSNNLTTSIPQQEEDSALVRLLDSNNHVRFSVYEITGADLSVQRENFNIHGPHEISFVYLGSKTYGDIVVKEFQNTPKQKILWIDMGAYGFTITDDSEGMSSIDYSTLVIR